MHQIGTRPMAMWRSPIWSDAYDADANGWTGNGDGVHGALANGDAAGSGHGSGSDRGVVVLMDDDGDGNGADRVGYSDSIH